MDKTTETKKGVLLCKITLNVPAKFLTDFDEMWKDAGYPNRTGAILEAMRGITPLIKRKR